MPSPVRRLVSPDNPSYTDGEHGPGGPTTAGPDDWMGQWEHTGGVMNRLRSGRDSDSDADMSHMAGLDGGHGWDNPRHAMRD